MRNNFLISGICLLALAPLTATADKVARAETTKQVAPEGLGLDTIVERHVAALGGDKLLRATKTMSFTVSGEKQGKAYTKTVTYARPNLMRVDIQMADGTMSKGFDGKVGWTKKASEAAVQMSAEETVNLASHAEFDEPLFDFAKRGTKVRLINKTEVDSKPAYDLEVTFANGEMEHHFLDASSYLLVKRTATGKDKDGKAKQVTMAFGDYKKIQGRMVNLSLTYTADDGQLHTNTVSKVSYDKPAPAKLFSMPK
ncbi:MAG: hypothetical protein WKG01_09300 [Kofleriaceae bacterium]